MTNLVDQNFSAAAIQKNCARIFREMVGLAHTVPVSSWEDARLLVEPMEALDVDSLTLLEFIMEIESDYDVELDEAAVNACRNLSELAALVTAAKQ
jgi:Phosphopantetheine attachment site